MSRDNQMVNDLIDIFDEEYEKRYLITPQNTAEKLTAKGYRKASEVAAEIFEELNKVIHRYLPIIKDHQWQGNLINDLAELRKKYEREGADDE